MHLSIVCPTLSLPSKGWANEGISKFSPLGQVSITNPPLYHRGLDCLHQCVTINSYFIFFNTCPTKTRFSELVGTLTLLLKFYSIEKWVQAGDYKHWTQGPKDPRTRGPEDPRTQVPTQAERLCHRP